MTSTFCIDENSCSECGDCLNNDPDDLVELGENNIPVWKSNHDYTINVGSEDYGKYDSFITNANCTSDSLTECG